MGVRIEAGAEPIQGYRLIERLGGGGFGEVWKCEAPGGLLKAIKFVFGTLETVGDNGHRAEQELKALKRVATVRHPYILSLERYDIVEGQLLIIMELADRNLWDRYRESRNQGLPGIPREELLGYMEESAEALDLMNSMYQLQHLDIKPQNLFLIHNHVKVADFGLVKDMDGSQASVTGGITPVYAAPETFDGRVTRFSDQYSLAIVFQELLTGQRPFSGASVRQLILQHLQAEPNVDNLDEADRPVVRRALSKTPDQRFPTCREFVRSLRHSIASGTLAEARGPVPTGHDSGARTPSSKATVAPEDMPASEEIETARARWGHAPLPAPEPNSPRAPVGFIPTPGGRARDSSNQPATHFIGVPPPGNPVPPRPAAQVETPPPSRTPQPSESLLPPPPEVGGSGALFPTLIVGLGGLGAQVLQAVRLALAERFGTPEALPNIRSLLLDTEPDVLKHLAQFLECPGVPPCPYPLLPTELLAAPLNRPSHYLRPPGGRVSAQSWINPRMLYRIPREQVTTGIRALGRLALFDHVKVIQRRLQMELEACRDAQTLEQVGKATGLGVRSYRPRVYLVTGLMGGTGSGMFLDMAYLLRQLLRQMGHASPEVTGLFFVPQLEKRGSRHPQGPRAGAPPAPIGAKGPAAPTPNRPSSQVANKGALNPERMVALANTYAALSELLYFARPFTEFTARYYEREDGLHDTGAPFARCYLLPLVDDPRKKESQEVVGMTARFLVGECASNFGRWRSSVGLSTMPPPMREPHYQTFGLYRVAFPRGEVVQQVSRECLRKVIQRWMSKDAAGMKEAVRSWVAEQWRGGKLNEGLGAEHFIGRIQDACQKRLGKDPEKAFLSAMEALAKQVTAMPTGDGKQSFLGRGKTLMPTLPMDELLEVLLRFEQMLGRPEITDKGGGAFVAADFGSPPPGNESVGERGSALTVQLPGMKAAPVGSLVQTLRETATVIANEWSQKLAEMPVKLIELPVYRLAGAEEAVRQVVATIEEVLERHEPLARELADRAAQAFGQVLMYVKDAEEAPARPRRLTPDKVVELLRTYSRSRYQSLVLQQVLGIYVSMRGCLTDVLREINFCRVRLQELLNLVAPPPTEGEQAVEKPVKVGRTRPLVEGRVRHLFPEGFENAEQAVTQLLERFTHEDLLFLDGQLQKVIRSNFVALVQVCLDKTNQTKALAGALKKIACGYVEEKLKAPDLAQLFLDRFGEDEAVQGELSTCYEEAVPDPPTSGAARSVRPPRQQVVMALPPGDGSDKLAALARQALPQDVEFVLAKSEDDLIVYREWSDLQLMDVDPLGPDGREAYEQMLAGDNFTPHSRSDINF